MKKIIRKIELRKIYAYKKYTHPAYTFFVAALICYFLFWVTLTNIIFSCMHHAHWLANLVVAALLITTNYFTTELAAIYGFFIRRRFKKLKVCAYCGHYNYRKNVCRWNKTDCKYFTGYGSRNLSEMPCEKFIDLYDYEEAINAERKRRTKKAAKKTGI